MAAVSNTRPTGEKTGGNKLALTAITGDGSVIEIHLAHKLKQFQLLPLSPIVLASWN